MRVMPPVCTSVAGKKAIDYWQDLWRIGIVKGVELLYNVV